jgi:hypothetical protein
MLVMLGKGRRTAVLLSVKAVGRKLMMRDLTEVQPGFSRIRTG